jgi:hypothetical protein
MSAAQHTPGGRLFVLADHPTAIGGETMARVIECHAAPIAERIVQCVNAHDELVAALRRALPALDRVAATDKTIDGYRSPAAIAADEARAAIAKATGAQGPAELWLQLHGDCSDAELDEPVDYTSNEVTWCWHQIHNSDVRYIRADLATPASAGEGEDERIPVALGPVALEFDSFQQWVNKAQGWFAALAKNNRNAAMKRYLSLDAAGRVCMIGGDFMRARDEGTFPVKVYLIDAALASGEGAPQEENGNG